MTGERTRQKASPARPSPGVAAAGDSGEPSAPHDPGDSEGGDLAGLIRRAQQGSAAARETLLRTHVAFVVRTAQRICRRELSLGWDDEVSVALIAFNEAIDCYRPGRGMSFAGFVTMVIQHRVIDLMRRNRARQEVPVAFAGDTAPVEPTDRAVTRAELREAMSAYQATFDSAELRDEIRTYQGVLRDHGMTLPDVLRACPRHADARQKAIGAARAVAEDPAWRAHLIERRRLPLKEMADNRAVGMSRRTLERHRTYIVAMALLFCFCGGLGRGRRPGAAPVGGRAQGA